MPGRSTGSVTHRNVRSGPAPALLAARSRLRSKPLSDAAITRKATGNRQHAVRDDHADARADKMEAAEKLIIAKRAHDGGHDQRQHDHQVHRALAAEAVAHVTERGGQCDDHGEHHGAERDDERVRRGAEPGIAVEILHVIAQPIARRRKRERDRGRERHRHDDRHRRDQEDRPRALARTSGMWRAIVIPTAGRGRRSGYRWQAGARSPRAARSRSPRQIPRPANPRSAG